MNTEGTIIDFKKRRLSVLSKSKKKPKGDSLGTKFDSIDKENHEIIYHARNLWDDLYDFRKRTERASRYHRGDQWGDMIWDPDSNEYMREEEYMLAKGRVPLKQNIIRQLIKNLLGQYRNNPTGTIVYAKNRQDAELSEMMSNAIRSVHDVNEIDQVDAFTFLGKVISGLAIQKARYRYIPEKDTEDIYVQPVSPNRIFFNGDIQDPRLTDIRIIGEILDLPLMDVITSFAETPSDEEKIRDVFGVDYFRNYISSHDALGKEMYKSLDFFIPHNTGMCRVIEVWFKKSEWRTYAHDYIDGSYKIVPYTLKEIDQINAQRIAQAIEAGVEQDDVPLIVARRKYDQYWYVKYLTPYGHCLYEGETPYDHGEHPYIMTIYPGIDGEVWGLVEEIIDQQRYINRAISLMDFIIASSAKGVLMVPEDSIPYDKGWTEKDFADEWTKVNGVIVYKAKPGVEAPSQISSNSIPVGLQELLATQLKLAYDIAGIHQAIQGQQAKSGTPATLYAQEAQNATINIKDFMETFSYFKQKRDTKIMKLIMQYYRDQRFLTVEETNFSKGAKIFDPAKIRNIQFDLKVTQGVDTPVFRQVIEDSLMGLFNAQAIDVKMLLEHSTMPYANKLLDSINRREQEMMQQQQAMAGGMAPQGGQIDPALIQQMGSAADQQMQALPPQTQGILNRMLNDQQVA